MTRIGFIGLGNLGGPMAANLAKAGHRVQVFDLVPESLSRAIEAGCTPRMPPQKMFWGDTYALCVDPFGVHWSMNQAGA